MKKRNPKTPGFAVLDGIGDRLLGNFIELQSHFLREGRQRVGHLKTTGQREGLSDGGYQFLEQAPEVRSVGIEIAKTMSQVMGVIDHLVEKLLDLASVGSFRGPFMGESGFERF